MSPDEPGYLRLSWASGQAAAGVTLVMRHGWRPFTAEEIRAVADTVEAIETFREMVADPEGLELP